MQQTHFFVLALCAGLLLGAPASKAQTLDFHLKVDQLGYLPQAAKVAVIADPQTGFDAAESYNPGSTLEVRRSSDNNAVFSGSPMAWNNGATHAASGDKAWWFDFSTLTTPGEYYVFDVANNTRSATFRIADNVYDDVLKTAVRTFFYQRCGVAKAATYAGDKWSDDVCHTKTGQDTQCRLHTNPSAASERDLSGGWHDAGDHNKYVNFSLGAVCDLLLAYQETPDAFTDDYNIPESGNGVPDLLDEVKVELNWLLKMQQPNGSVLCVVGGGGGAPPSADTQVRRYGPATTSASFSAAAMLALGARVYESAGQTAFAQQLETAAVAAWTWAKNNPGVTFYNSGQLAAGEQEVDTYGLYATRLCAAVYLFAQTGDAEYKTWVDNNYNQHHLFQWSWASMFENTSLDALLQYAALPNATSSVAEQIRNSYRNSITGSDDHLPGFTNGLDPYRAHLRSDNYTWGSNSIKSKEAVMLWNTITYDLAASQDATVYQATAGHVHYLHGVNPLAMCFLTNVGDLGVEQSLREMYHSWFGDGTAWDNASTSSKGPAPGYVTGGPNKYYSLDGCCPSGCGSAGNNALCVSFSPPLGQPAMKSYKDWNTSWPQNSWQITEPAIYYQAAYIRLLSKFTSASVVGTEMPQKAALAFTLAPNPARSTCMVSLDLPTASAVNLRLLNANGQVVYQQQQSRQSGVHQINVPLTQLPSGVYAIEVKTALGIGMKTLIVQ